MFFDDKLHDECGVFGAYFPESDVALGNITYLALYALQHRGQESAGIASSDGAKIKMKKGQGLVADVFTEDNLSTLDGKISLGHVRYSTTGGNDPINAQPIVNSFKHGDIAVCHNGNLVNVDILKDMFEELGYSFATTSDSEIIIKMIARSAKKGIEKAIKDTIQAIKGSYALAMIVDNKLVGVRDPNGIRPLCLGKLGSGYVLSSESCAFDAIGATFERDILPGEIVIISDDGVKSILQNEKTHSQSCAFEYIYFARPDSIIDKISVHSARKKAGEILWNESPVDADVVIGVPDSGLDAALGLAIASGIPYDNGLIKNKYVGRSFILPDQKARELAVNIKLNPIKESVYGKRVILIDDSIVRGTTSKQLIELLRNAGAKEVHMRVSSPVVGYPCYFGIDTPNREHLIGAKMSIPEINAFLGTDTLAFLSIDGLLKSLANSHNHNFCIGCLTGEYPISVQMN